MGHTGSTVIDMSLGCNSKIVGLGEVVNLLKSGGDNFSKQDFTQIKCSCGKDMNHCDFWSGLKTDLVKYQQEVLEIKYDRLIDYFNNKYGDNIILVDSSKNSTGYLTYLNNKYDLRILFLVRDFRGWAFSRRQRNGNSYISLAINWMKANLRFKQFLNANKMNYLTIGYEEIALFPELLLKKICEFLDIPFENEMLAPHKTKSHIIRGNVDKGDTEKMKNISYYCRWFTSTGLAILSPFFLPIVIWNNKHVYSNIKTGKAKAFGRTVADFEIFSSKRKETINKSMRSK